MRTLKKVLALSLVFAMAFTMMAGAAFKDQNKIDSSLNDDISLLTALGVFKGDENGNFNPTANVKRSEAAKMIYVLKNNGVDDGAVAFQGVSKYADVPVGHWAEGYINYCTNLGYMGGWKEGNVQKFDPNGNVTGVELMKMLLCMIGYKADVQGYTGNGWQTNVLVDAATSGLSVEFVPSVYAATPRQWTARLMVNAINAPFVTYNRGELMYGTWAQPDMSYGEQYLGLVTVEGTLEATNHNKLASDNAISSSFNDTDTVKVQSKGGAVYAVGDADENLLGQPVKMYYKKASGVNTENKLYAVLPYVKEGKIVNTTVDAVKVDSNNAKKITVDGLGTKTYGTQKIDVYVNNVKVKDQVEMSDVANTYLGTNSTDAVTLVADKDNYITKVLINDMVAYGQIDKIDAAKNNLVFKDVSKWLNTKASGNKLLAADSTTALVFDNSSANKDNFNKYLNVASNVKNGSVVKITANTSTGKLVYDITLADKVESTPTGYTLNSAGNAYASLTINGESVKLAGSDNFLSQYKWDTTGTSVANDKTFYTDGKYVIFSEGGTTSASVENLAYITAKDSTTAWGKTTYKVKALLADGTLGEYEVAATYNASGTKTDETDVTGGVDQSLLTGVVSYSISDGKITLRVLKGDSNITFAKGVQDYIHSNKTVKVDTAGTDASYTTYAVDSNAYFFVKSTPVGGKTKYSVVKASELAKDQISKNTALTADYAHKTVNGVPTLLFGTLELTSSVVASDADYAFVKSNASYKLVDGKHTVLMTVANNKGEEIIIKKTYSDLASANGDIKTWSDLRGKVITYTVNSEGNVESIKRVDKVNADTAVAAEKWNKIEIQGWNNNVANVKVASGVKDELVNVASDVKIHYVDATSNAYAALTTGSGVENTVTDGQQSAFAYVQNVNGVNTITDIFVEVSGAKIDLVW